MIAIAIGLNAVIDMAFTIAVLIYFLFSLGAFNRITTHSLMYGLGIIVCYIIVRGLYDVWFLCSRKKYKKMKTEIDSNPELIRDFSRYDEKINDFEIIEEILEGGKREVRTAVTVLAVSLFLGLMSSYFFEIRFSLAFTILYFICGTIGYFNVYKKNDKDKNNKTEEDDNNEFDGE